MKQLTPHSTEAPTNVGRRRCLHVSLGLGVLLAQPVQAAAVQAAAIDWQQRLFLGFGTSLWLRAAHPNKPHLNRALDAAVKAIRHVERQMSLFDPDSAVSHLNRTGFLRAPDADLVAALELSQMVSRRHPGTFDVTIQPLWRTWAQARARHLMPTSDALQRASAAVNWRDLTVTPEQIAFAKPGMAVTLNGIAQGYAADLARKVLLEHDIEHALLDTGEWTPIGKSPQATPWRLGLQDPASTANQIAIIESDGRSIATSSDAHYRFTPDGLNHHILDPNTGLSPTAIASVSVAANSCALADALTKVMFMGNVNQAIQLAGQWGVDVLAVGKDGNWQASAGMPLMRSAR